MALILNIETSTTNCSVSLALNGKLFEIIEENDKNYSHSERLHLYIKEVLEKADTEANQLDAIAISKGPGSYTGLRIGVSTAKGLCFALDIPLISLLTLEVLAHQVKASEGVIVPMLDARRMEVYTSVYDNHYNLIKDTEAIILDDTSFESFLVNKKVHFVGNGVEKTKSIIGHENAIFIDDKLPSAREMGQLSFNKYLKSDFEDVAYFEPFYLKDFIALKATKK